MNIIDLNVNEVLKNKYTKREKIFFSVINNDTLNKIIRYKYAVF